MSFACHLHVSCMRSCFIYKHSYLIRMSVVCTRISSVCYSCVIGCHPYFTRMYSYVIRMSLVCTRISSVCHSYVLVCHLNATRMYSYVIRMSLVCTRMSFVCPSYVLVCHSYCHSYVVLPWTGRKMRITQIYTCVLLYFLWKAVAFDVPSQLSKWW